MVTTSAHDAARELRRQLAGVETVKLHKTLYHVQGWHLAWTGQPAFSEDIAARADGPVVADLWRAEMHGDKTPPDQEPDDKLKAVIAYVVANYGQLTGKQLIARTHQERPWRDASERGSDVLPFTDIIDPATIAQFFADLNARHPVTRILDANPGARERIHKDLVEARTRTPVPDAPEALKTLPRG
jgi:uncharacterized phage-associated protein